MHDDLAALIREQLAAGAAVIIVPPGAVRLIARGPAAPPPDAAPPGNGRLVYSVPEAARQLGVSRSLAYELMNRGELPSIRVGSRRLVPHQAIEAYIAAQLGGGRRD